MMIRHLLSLSLIPLALTVSQTALAHKVNLFTYQEGDQIQIEGYFNDGKAAMNGKISVTDDDGTLLFEGITDDKGLLSFPLPKARPIHIKLNASMGHVTETTLGDDDLIDGMAGAAVLTDAASDPAAGPGMGLSPAQLQRLVQTSVQHALHPLLKAMDEQREKASLGNILGGLGLIMGLLGGFAYAQARKLQKQAGSSS